MAEQSEYPLIAVARFSEYGGTNGFAFVNVEIMQEREGAPYGMGMWDAYKDLGMSCQLDEHNKEAYGFHTVFKPHKVELRDAERITKVLRKIERHLETVRSKQGSPDNFGEYVQRVLTCLKIKKVYLMDPTWVAPTWALNKYIIPETLDEAGRIINERVDQKISAWQNTPWRYEPL